MKNIWLVGVIAVVVAVPLILRPHGERGPRAEDVLVIVSPHNEAVRYEFSSAFSEHYRKETGREVLIDWRTPGGTSEIARYLASEYLASFQNYWTVTLARKWDGTVEAAFENSRIELDASPEDDSPPEAARRAFLESDVGCGIDLFFGGGAYDFGVQAAAGRLVDSGILKRHSAWFGKNGIPQNLGGEELWDPGGRWVGACLSAFGICYNVDVLAMLGVGETPSQWKDLADPRFLGQVGLADPTQSGSAAKAFEMLIQQQMQKRLSSGDTEVEAVERGWIDGLRIIQRAAGNARYFSDSASKVPWDVELGDAAIGMCIDFYGRFQSEAVRKSDGTSRLIYITPSGGSSVGADPIGLLRGAPHRDLADRFLDFVLSVEGQKLWNFKVGVSGGPRRFALRRLPIRPDLYARVWTDLRSDPAVDPYREAGAFVYRGEWTGALFSSIRFIVRTMCIDAHNELRSAWRELVAADFPPQATSVFGDLSRVRYAVASGEIRRTLRSSDKIGQVRLAKELSDSFRAQFRKAEQLAVSRK